MPCFPAKRLIQEFFCVVPMLISCLTGDHEIQDCNLIKIQIYSRLSIYIGIHVLITFDQQVISLYCK